MTNITDLRATQTSGGYTLYSVTHIGGGMASYRIAAADQPIEMTSARAWGPQVGYLDRPAVALVNAGGGTAIFGTGLSNSIGSGAMLDASGGLDSAAAFGGMGGLGRDVKLMGSFTTPQGEFIFSARDNRPTFETWRVNADGSISAVAKSDLPWGLGIPGTQIDDMKTVAIGDRTFMLSTSAQGNYLAIQGVNGDGTLGAARLLWADRGLGLNAPSHIATVTVMGVTYLVVASAQSSSLTTLRVTYGGTLEPADHIIDELGTRFRGASALDAVMLDGRAFIFAGGADDGISVFTIMPDGHLLHLATLIDADDRAMADVSSISAVVIDGRIAVFVASRTERGVTQFVFEPGQIGQTTVTGSGRVTGTSGADMLRAGSQTTTLIGGDGDDILIAGSTQVTMTGGEGSDLFVAAEVNGRIVITDFEPGKDRLDLSGLGMIRSMSQLVFSPQSDGIKIFFGNSVVWIRTRDGSGLQANFFDNSLFPIAHYDPPDMRSNIMGTPRNDTLTAGRYGSNMYGLAGNDLMQGGDGNDMMQGGDGNDWLNGYAGDDQLSGNNGDDVIRGGAGNDVIRGGNGNDTLYGGDGTDTIQGEAGDDRIYGERGDDFIVDQLGNNAIWAGFGNDRIITGPGHDTIFGQDGDDNINSAGGNDRIWGGPGNDTINAGAGDDLVYGDAGDDLIYGGDGNDHLSGDDGNDTLAGHGGNDWLGGGAGNDLLIGGPGHDTLIGGAGNDVLNGEAGNDRLLGGDGHDTLSGGDGDDVLMGEDGNDMLDGGAGHDQLSGGAGNDTLWGQAGNDALYGQDGDDLLSGGDGNDTLVGQAGNDTIWGGAGNDRMEGHDGDDVLMGEAGNDFMIGGLGNDTLMGGDGDDLLRGSEGDDLLSGNGGNDTLEGGAGKDTLWGGGGFDLLVGGEGDDLIYGGDGGDTLDGGTGSDTLFGDAGNDLLTDLYGNNILSGGAGNDTLIGGGGNDTLQGGSGSDRLQGGAGWDVFVFTNPDDFDRSTDTIVDFQGGQDLMDFRGLGLSFIGQDAFSGAPQLRSYWTAETGRMLEIDLNGDGVTDLAVSLGSILAITAGDLLL
ncbi:calcium-binding protein [Paracoccus shanxieyensis]|uniref:calcium-binding protein n=1 Tax=Paracoccus shanxieyensis TaxID=2675752 RepID=UPI0031343E92